MKHYQIWFTNNHDKFTELGGETLNETLRENYAESYFETDDVEHFVTMFNAIIENPIAMWYWVIVNGEVHISGAIDTDDSEYFDEIPDVVQYHNEANEGNDELEMPWDYGKHFE